MLGDFQKQAFIVLWFTYLTAKKMMGAMVR